MNATVQPATVLVTGASGFLGRTLVERLRQRGRSVVPVDRLDRGLLDGLVLTDLTDVAAVDALLAMHQPHAVVHLAAFGAGAAGLVASAEQQPREAVRVNLVAFADLLDACARHDVQRLVWSSSTTVYGPATLYGDAASVDEDALLAPFTVYGATKLIGERISAEANRRGGISTVALRLPLIYGPGHWYGGAQASWFAFVEAARTGRGGHFSFDPTPTDWMYVTDATDAMIAALDAPTVPRPAYNAVGHVTSTLDMARAVAHHTHADVDLRAGRGGPPLVLLDGRRITTELGFSPQVTDVDAGIRRYLAALADAVAPTRT